jgi:peptidoglycan hydrolase CwlO-like protein
MILRILLAFLILFTTPFRVSAIECGGQVPEDPDGLNAYIKDCSDKIAATKGVQATLSSAIQHFNNQISLTQAQITSTAKEISTLELTIADLSTKIESINYSLTDLTKLFIERVKATYKSKSYNPIAAVLSPHSFAQFVNNLSYLQAARDNDQKIMIMLEKTRLDYDAQKSLQQQKQDELEETRQKLTAQQNTLSRQRAEKDALLKDTQNDERKYQSLLSQARAQLAAFRRFTSTQGGATLLSNQTSCDDWGCYYNQRDAQWGNQLIGLSTSSTMREYGCLVTSMAMIASHYGRSLNPGQIAASSEPFWLNTAYMRQGQWTVGGVTMTRTRLGSSRASIDQELEAGRPVVVGIYGGPDHFLVITKKDGDDYIMHDPFPSGGGGIKFTSKYPLSAISAVDRVTVQ